MAKISYTEGGLLIDGEPIEIPTSVAQVLQTEDLVIVRLDPDDEYDKARNVWAFDDDAKLIWEIKRATKKGDEHYRYTNIWLDDGELWAYNWNGIAYEVDLESGELRDSRSMK